MDVAFEKTPLRDVTAQLATHVEVPISVDVRGQGWPTGIDLDTPVSLEVKGRRLAVEVWDEGLVVTGAEKTSVAVYPVGRIGGGDRSVGSLAVSVGDQVNPNSWASKGCQGLVIPIDGDVPCLVVLQTTAGHRAVHSFLESLGPSGEPGDFAPTLEPEPASPQKMAPMGGGVF